MYHIRHLGVDGELDPLDGGHGGQVLPVLLREGVGVLGGCSVGEVKGEIVGEVAGGLSGFG